MSNAADIQTTSRYISRYQQTEFTAAHIFDSAFTCALPHVTVKRLTFVTLLSKTFCEFIGATFSRRKDNSLF